MNRVGHKGRVDANQAEVLRALRDAGMKPVSLASVGNGVPDILVGYRGINVLLEGKSGSGKALTKVEAEWHATWPGQVEVICTPDQAVDAVLAEARKRGVL